MAQRLADQAGGIGVLDQTTNQRFRAGNADADAAFLAQFSFSRLDQPGDALQRGLIIALWRSTGLCRFV